MNDLFNLHLHLYLELKVQAVFATYVLHRCSLFLLQFPSCQNSIDCGQVLQTYVSVQSSISLDYLTLRSTQLINLNREKAMIEKGQFHKISDPSLQFIGVRVAILCNHLSDRKSNKSEKKKKKSLIHSGMESTAVLSNKSKLCFVATYQYY